MGATAGHRADRHIGQSILHTQRDRDTTAPREPHVTSKSITFVGNSICLHTQHIEIEHTILEIEATHTRHRHQQQQQKTITHTHTSNNTQFRCSLLLCARHNETICCSCLPRNASPGRRLLEHVRLVRNWD